MATANDGETEINTSNKRAREKDVILIEEDGFKEYKESNNDPKLHSKVWKDFKRVVDKEKKEIKAICKHCHEELTAKVSSGTSHLKRHIDNHCNALKNRSLHGFYKLSVEKGDDDMCSLKNHKFDNNELRKYISMFVVEGTHPFSIVEEKGFRRMILKANPEFKPFGRHTLKRELMSLYVKERDRLREFLESAPGRICLTTDNWKSQHTKEEYICVTAHFIDAKWKLNKKILRFRSLIPPYDGMCIANELRLFLSQWKIENKLFSISTDNASYNDSMISFVRNSLIAKQFLICHGEFFHIRCCAHVLNLIVQSGLDAIGPVLDRIRDMVKYIDRSSKRRQKFFDLAEKSFSLQTLKKFRLDMPVRWNSTYIMLDRMLYYKDVFMHFAGRDQTLRSFMISEQEWDDLRVLHRFLKIFYEVTCLFSGSKYPTSNLYFRGVWKVHMRLLEMANGPYTFLSGMVKGMQQKFDKYWGEYNAILSCATILDPRCKVNFLHFCFEKVYGADRAEIYVEKVLSTLRRLYEDYKPKSSNICSMEPYVGETSLDNKSNADLDDFEDYSLFINKNHSSVSEKSQLDLYLDEPSLDLNTDLNVLEFWSKCSMRYPELSAMARDIFTIPVTTVASESAFSLGGKTITTTRSSLKSKTVQALVCLQDWSRGLDTSICKSDDGSGSSDDDIEKMDGEDDSDLADCF